ncbi:hypothetical protein GCM10009577_87010 [Streptomyces javensis]
MVVRRHGGIVGPHAAVLLQPHGGMSVGGSGLRCRDAGSHTIRKAGVLTLAGLADSVDGREPKLRSCHQRDRLSW